MTDEERDKLIEKLHEFDASDRYHDQDHFPEGDNELDFARGYYAAIDRAIALLRGEITDWMSPRRCETCHQPLPKSEEPLVLKDNCDSIEGEPQFGIGWNGHPRQCIFEHNGIRCSSLNDHLGEHLSLPYRKVFRDEHWMDVPKGGRR